MCGRGHGLAYRRSASRQVRPGSAARSWLSIVATVCLAGTAAMVNVTVEWDDRRL